MLVKTICRICRCRCGIEVEVRDGRILSVAGDADNPRSRGFLCPKGRAIPEVVYAPDRLRFPLKKMGERWERIALEAAFSEIGARLQDIKSKYGPESFDIMGGEASLNEGLGLYLDRFGYAYGTPNSATWGLCQTVKIMGNRLTYGKLLVPDYRNSNCIILWGTNLSTSEPLHGCDVMAAAEQGAKLIVVDPARTHAAKRADLHLRVRPGTDGALALGMMHVIIKEGLHDKDFIEKWTVGFDQLIELVNEYPPESVETITWVPADSIRDAARLYAKTKPACIYYGNSTEHHSNGTQSMRAIAMLQALTGNVDIAGGALIPEDARLGNPGMPGKRNGTAKAIGESEYPLYYQTSKGALGNLLADAILSGRPYPVKSMFVIGGNPALSHPNATKMKEALKRLDLLVVADLFMTETASLAHFVLPSAHFMERTELNVRFGDPIFCPKVIPEQGEAVSSLGIIRGLFASMGCQDQFPWKNDEEAIAFRLEPTGVTLEQAKNDPEVFCHRGQRYRKYESNGFGTPSRKVELYSENLAALGYSPVPRFSEPSESYNSDPELTKKYPVMLTTRARVLEYSQSQFRNIPSLRGKEPEAVVEVHPQLAAELCIHDGDAVIVETRRGKIQVKAQLSEVTHPRIVQMVNGWSEANLNTLTDDESLDPVSGFPPLRSIMCRITKVTPEGSFQESGFPG